MEAITGRVFSYLLLPNQRSYAAESYVFHLGMLCME